VSYEEEDKCVSVVYLSCVDLWIVLICVMM
jgi:hypothetical protein